MGGQGLMAFRACKCSEQGRYNKQHTLDSD